MMTPNHIIENSFKMLTKMLEVSDVRYTQFKLLHNRIVKKKSIVGKAILATKKFFLQ